MSYMVSILEHKLVLHTSQVPLLDDDLLFLNEVKAKLALVDKLISELKWFKVQRIITDIEPSEYTFNWDTQVEAELMYLRAAGVRGYVVLCSGDGQHFEKYILDDEKLRVLHGRLLFSDDSEMLEAKQLGPMKLVDEDITVTLANLSLFTDEELAILTQNVDDLSGYVADEVMETHFLDALKSAARSYIDEKKYVRGGDSEETE